MESEMSNSAVKVTTGFVIQNYNDSGVCTESSFVASDECEWETIHGEAIDPLEDAIYEPFSMVQPGEDLNGLFLISLLTKPLDGGPGSVTLASFVVPAPNLSDALGKAESLSDGFLKLIPEDLIERFGIKTSEDIQITGVSVRDQINKGSVEYERLLKSAIDG